MATVLKTMSVSPEDAQYLQSRDFLVQEIAGCYGVPLRKPRELSRNTSDNIALHRIITQYCELFERALLTVSPGPDAL